MARPTTSLVAARGRTLAAVALIVGCVAALGPAGAGAQKTPPCVLAPQLRDVTINQGVGAYTPLVNGKETLVRFYLSMPSCAGSGASIQITGARLDLSGGATGNIPTPTPALSSTAFPIIAAYTAAPMADSTGDPKFVVPASMVSKATGFSANFTATISYQSKATRSGSYGPVQQIPLSNRPGTTTPISASFSGPTNALSVLFVPMGDATKTYNTQWRTEAQQALQDGMTAAVARQYPLPAGIGSLLPGATAGLRYMVAPTLLDLKRLNLLDANGKFCGTGGNYDAIKAELAQFRLSHNTANPNAQANRVVGVIDPNIALLPPSPCFEGMAVVNSQEAWAVARPGRAGQLIGLELAHTLGLTPPNRESPFDGAHSQNITAENPSLNRRYNLVQRSFITTDRSLMKPSGTSPSPDNINTLLEVPDFAFLLCVFGGPVISECTTYGPGTVSANAPVAATLSFVMSGSTTGQAGLPSPTGTGAATGTSVVESYFASTVPQTSPVASSEYRLVQRNAAGGILPAPNGNQGVPVSFRHSEHGTGSGSTTHSSGLFSFALPFDTNANRIELWKGSPGASGSLLLYAQNRTAAPQVTGLSVGSGPILLGGPGFRAPHSTAATAAPLATFTVTNTNDSGGGSLRQAITDANANAGADTVTFEIPGTGVHTISPTSPLPHLTGPTILDATTEDDYVAGGAPRVELNGTSVGGPGIAFWVEGANSEIRGFTINRCPSFAIYIDSTATGTIVAANYIGLDAAGTLDVGNGGGIQVLASGATIGGSTAAARNVIAGVDNTAISLQGGSAIVRGNYVGTSADGMSAIGNLEGIVVGSSGNTIGGPNSGDGNVLSGSTSTTSGGAGVWLAGAIANNTIERNLIGTNKDGTAAIPHSRRGVLAQSTGANNVIRGNVISGNNGDGISISGQSVIVVGNSIGTNAAGTAALANTGFGLQVTGAGLNSIGGSAPGAGNVIAGNASGGVVLNSAGNTVQGNSIGTTASGSPLPNGFDGIRIVSAGTNNVIGDVTAGGANRISNNGRNGVRIEGGTGNRIRGNQVTANGALGIDLAGDGVTANDAGDADTGPNNLQNFPTLTSATGGGVATSVSGTLDSAAGSYSIDFFANAACDGTHGEGERFLGSTTVSDPGPFAASDLAPTTAGEAVTATATDSAGNTSEFSACETVTGGGGGTQPGPTFTVNTNSDGTPTDVGCTTTECTLREAVTAANSQAGANTIEFDIGGDTQIALQDPLPAITSPVLVDGLSQPEGTIVINGDGAGEAIGLQLVTGSGGSEIRGLEIRDFFSGSGIAITSANNTIASNYIHSNGDGIHISGSSATGNVIGDDVGPSDLALVDYDLGNVLGANDSDGLEITGGASGTKVVGNSIGTDRPRTATDLGNGSTGIRIDSSSSNQLGPGNAVARNGVVNSGIRILSGSGNRIVANSIHHNTGMGIDISEGANSDIPEPVLTSATSSGGTTTVTGTFRGGLGVSDGTYFVEFFKNAACDTEGGSGEGETFLTFATVTGSTASGGSFTANVGGLAIGDVVTATLTRGHAPPDTSEFSNCRTVTQALPANQEPWSASASDTDNIADATLDGYLDCGDGVLQVVFVGKKPDSVQGNTAHWSGTIDTSLAEDGCEFKVAATDQFTRPPITSTGTETVNDGPNTVIAAISSPREGGTVLQYGLIPLRGLILDAQGVIATGQHQWTLTGPGGFARSGTGVFRDEQPPAGGWPFASASAISASYTATLTKPGNTEPSATDSVTFTVLRDGDNDGIPKTIEDSCLGGGDDDATNFYADRDSDGIPNADDPQPCVAATSYTAIVEINPDPLPIPSNGNPVTATVRVPGRNVAQVLASTVRITRIAEHDVSTNNDFRNIGWTISNGVGTAKFDRPKLIAFLTANNLRNRLVTITVGGRSGAPPWNFEGSDTIFVH